MTEPKSILAWWFCANDKLPNGDNRPVVIGEKLTVAPPIELCRRGLHASVKIMDACRFAPGSILYRVKLSGEIVHDHEKHAASERTPLWRLDCDKIFRLFAADCAERALKRERRKKQEPDPRSWAAVQAARDFAHGKITKKQLAAALDAAREAAWDAARAAARAAALDAAREAARAAAWDAARAAAWDAARAAAREAAWDAERKWQERHLLSMIRAARCEQKRNLP